MRIVKEHLNDMDFTMVQHMLLARTSKQGCGEQTGTSTKTAGRMRKEARARQRSKTGKLSSCGMLKGKHDSLCVIFLSVAGA